MANTEAIAKRVNEASTATVTDAVSLFRYELAQLRAEMRQEIAAMQVRLTATMIAVAGIAVVVMKYTP